MPNAAGVTVFCLAILDFVHASQGHEGLKLRALEQKLLEIIRDEFPEFSESAGLSQNDGRAESYTFQGFERRNNRNLQLLQQVEKIDRNQLSRDELNDWKILRYHVQTILKGYKFREWGNLNPINSLEAPLKHRDWISKKMTQDREKYVLRLQAIPQQIEEQISLMRRAIKLNRTNHFISMNGTQESIWNDVFFIYQHTNRNSVNGSSQGSQSNLLETWNLSTDKLAESLMNLQTFISTEYFPATRSDIGLHSMPGGQEYYQACLDYHLGTHLTPSEIHSLGYREVDRLEGLMRKIMLQYGFTGKISEFLQFWQTKNRQQDKKWNIYQVYRDVIDHARDSLGRVFHKIPLTPLRIELFNNSRVPARGHYTKNMFYLNIFYGNRTNSNVLPLAFHETYPGHHFQECYKRQQNLPLYRQYPLYRRRFAIPFTYPTYAAYTEGWALYAEHIGIELGFYETPLDMFQKYMSEIFRACRLIVDTGIHAFGWTKERAIDFMKNYTNAPTGEIAREIDRYITWPGQACAYKVGELKIRELRQQAETMLGDRFNVKDFHHQILKLGPIGLDILEEIINDWIAMTSVTPLVPPNSHPRLSPHTYTSSAAGHRQLFHIILFLSSLGHLLCWRL